MMEKEELTIGGRKVGPEYPPLVIPDIGINHGGNLDVAMKMVKAAASSGAEIVKHQTHVLEDEMSSAARSIIPGNADVSIYEIMAQCALDESDEKTLMEFAESLGMIYLSTPFSRAAADRLEGFGVKAYKIGSGECNNYPLLEHIASFGKPIILSTGMNTLEGVARAVAIFDKHNVDYALLHCTNIYPTPPELVRLGALKEMREAFPQAVLGLSDHTITNHVCMGAVALGACVIERHFTDSMDREGPDIVCSMDPTALTDMINGSRIIHAARNGGKGPIKEEQATIDFAYATVVTIKPVKAGESFSSENIWVKRPGTGDFLAQDFDMLLGKTATRDLSADVHLVKSDVEGVVL